MWLRLWQNESVSNMVLSVFMDSAEGISEIYDFLLVFYDIVWIWNEGCVLVHTPILGSGQLKWDLGVASVIIFRC